MVKSTAWNKGGLGFDSYRCATGINCRATLQATAVIQLLDPTTGALLWSQGNSQISISVWDNTGTSNNNGVDQFTVSIVLPSGAMYHLCGSVDAPLNLMGGNVVVHAAKT